MKKYFKTIKFLSIFGLVFTIFTGCGYTIVKVNEDRIENNAPNPPRQEENEDEVSEIDDVSQPEEYAEYKDMIRLFSPLSEENVKSPLIIKGEARGNWYFEATFPVVLTNWDGLIIAEGYAQADGNWMTNEYVPFTATLEFDSNQVSTRGSLILQKSNASGLPQNDDAFEITVFLE